MKIYDHIYRQGSEIFHRKKGRLGAYGSHTGRDPHFVEFLTKYLPEGGRILDASCGRGHLARTLKELGYSVVVTEISEWLIDNELDDLESHCLRYDELADLKSESFDAVISNDVLEHLLSKVDVVDAVDNLVNLSRKYVLISVGTTNNPVRKYPESLGMNLRSLHLVVEKIAWWRKTFAEKIYPIGIHKLPSNFMFFGRKKECVSLSSEVTGSSGAI